MEICILLLLVFCLRIKFSTAINDPSYLPHVSLNCGSVGISTPVNGREWIGDTDLKFGTLLQVKGKSTTSSSNQKLTTDDLVVYKTARLSHTLFFYSFQLSPGLKILRLHFNPTPYKGFTSFQDLFSVEAGNFTLLGNFSASLTAQALGEKTFTKEFYISVTENQPLHIFFSPSIIPSIVKTYAFINGIEIVSIPANLFCFNGGDLGAQVVGEKYLACIDNSTVLETIHRTNLRRDSDLIGDEFDRFGMWGTVPKQKENRINILAWKRLVDIGFRYLVRIHFSEHAIAQTGNVNFKVLINELMVESKDLDSLKKADEYNSLRYRDYIVVMNGRKQDGQRDLSISLNINNEFIARYEIFKGIEIFKLSNPDNSLASPNPAHPLH